jgi:Ca2+-transporting ATPase
MGGFFILNWRIRFFVLYFNKWIKKLAKFFCMKAEVFSYQGLSSRQAADRLLKYGPNELPVKDSRGFFWILLEVIKEPMIFLLMACSGVYFVLGDRAEAILMIGCFLFVIIIEVIQENKTEKTLKALKSLSSPRALVIRGGQPIKIAGREVVVGDIIVLYEGDRVTADALVVEATNFSVDESILTGESVAVDKKHWSSAGEPPESRKNRQDYYIYSGTLVTKGRAVARVMKIGGETEMGKIGLSLKIIKPEKTFLQAETTKIVKGFALVAGVVSSIVLLYFFLAKQDLIQGILSGLTLAISILPEEFPVVLTVFLALGAWRISRKQVLARRVTAVEMLGATTVLCSDKTGTLTQNKMTIEELWIGDKILTIGAKDKSLPKSYQQIVEYAVLASPADPFDPMEKAIHLLAKQVLNKDNSWSLIKEYSLSDSFLAMSRVWRDSNKKLIVATKGAPEAIIDLCHLPSSEAKNILAKVQLMATDGMRVIAVAKANYLKIDLPTNQHNYDFEFVGLIGLADPIRPEAKQSIAECYTAGIRVIMITGDYPATAKHIAKELGLDMGSTILTGADIEKLSVVELRKKVASVNIFARVAPEQKLKLVQALKANGQVVAMTGDGVNDAPALKVAHIGVAMGGRGTDVAREASGLVLLDDNFASIVAAIRMGRRVYDNIKKAMNYLLIVHLPIISMSVIPLFFGMPIALLPAHIVFLELVIDPACSVAFEMEREEAGIMNRPPRNPKEKIFDRRTATKSIIRGLLASLVCVFIYMWGVKHWSLEEARLVSFSSLLAINLAYIFIGRSETRNIFKTLFIPNLAVWLIIIGAILVQVVILSLPSVSHLFGFGFFKIWHLNWILTAFVFTVIIGESTKILIKK